LEKQQAAILAAAQARGEKLANFVVSIAQKAGVDGRLFGSVTNGDIAESLVAQGFEVTKALVRMPDGPLKTIGDHAVTVALHHDVVVGITVTVVAEA
jgi:large subunit ribosomal protein L9